MMDGTTLVGLVIGAPLVVTYISVMTKLLLDYLTTHEVFHGPKNGNQ